MPRAGAWLTLLILLPTVSAGTPERPELRDDSDDQDPGGPVTAHADILGAWVDQDTNASFRLNLRVASLTPASTGVYELGFGQSGAGIFPEGFDGVGVALAPPGPSFYRIGDQSASVCSVTTPAAGTKPMTGLVENGSPGTLRWILEQPVPQALDGIRLLDFCARTWTDAGGRKLLDDATGPDAFYQIGLDRHIRVQAIPLSTPQPLLSDGPDPPYIGPADLTGLWIDFNPGDVNATLRLRSLDPKDFPGHCTWQVTFDLYGPQRTVQADIALEFDNATLFAYQAAGRANGPQLVSMQYGSPGYFRFTLPPQPNPPDLAQSDIHSYVVSYCGESQVGADAITASSHVGFEPFPGFASVVAVVAGAALAWRLRARRR